MLNLLQFNIEFFLLFSNGIFQLNSSQRSSQLLHQQTKPVFFLTNLISLISRNFITKREINRNKIFVFLPNNFLIAGHLVQLLKVTQLIGQSFGK